MLDLPDAHEYDRAVTASDGIDRWCSSTDWVLPLTASMRAVDPTAIRTPSGWGLFDRMTDEEGRRILMGVDRVWGFACPVIGRPGVWAEIAREIEPHGYDVIVIGGLVEGGHSWHEALAAFDRTHLLHRAGGITRRRADLRDGLDAWLGRRSSRFRQRLRRLARDAAHGSLTIEEADAEDGTALLDRLVAIEQQSWKGPVGEGLASPDMAAFYRLVLERLGPARTRALVARLDGVDVGYIVGGIRDSTYRGLQLSATAAAREVGAGHLLQFSQIERLCAEGVDTYDLGMDMTYKERWSDDTLATTTIAAFPRSGETWVNAGGR